RESGHRACGSTGAGLLGRPAPRASGLSLWWRQLRARPAVHRTAGPPLAYFEVWAGVDVLGAEVEGLAVLGAAGEAGGAGAGAGLAGADIEVLGVGFAAVCMPTG